MSVSISAVIVVAVVFASLLLIRFGVKQDQVARDARARPGARSILAITAFIVACVIPPIGVLLGHISLFRIGTGQDRGRHWAEGALWMGYFLLISEVVVFLLVQGREPWF